MRYTTIIDIAQCPEIYRNINARLTYLHMVLTCGYHDNDKGLVRKSVRQLSAETGITKLPVIRAAAINPDSDSLHFLINVDFFID